MAGEARRNNDNAVPIIQDDDRANNGMSPERRFPRAACGSNAEDDNSSSQELLSPRAVILDAFLDRFEQVKPGRCVIPFAQERTAV